MGINNATQTQMARLLLLCCLDGTRKMCPQQRILTLQLLQVGNCLI